MLSLIEWRREIFKIYSDVRAERNGALAWRKWKTKEKNFSDTIRKAQLLMQKERLDLILLQFCIHTIQTFVYHQNIRF